MVVQMNVDIWGRTKLNYSSIQPIWGLTLKSLRLDRSEKHILRLCSIYILFNKKNINIWWTYKTFYCMIFPLPDMPNSAFFPVIFILHWHIPSFSLQFQRKLQIHLQFIPSMQWLVFDTSIWFIEQFEYITERLRDALM